MEIRAEKTKLMTKNTSGINKEIKVNGQKLETVISFKCLGSVVSDEGFKPEILSRTAQTTAKCIWHTVSLTQRANYNLDRLHKLVNRLKTVPPPPPPTPPTYSGGLISVGIYTENTQ